ncbi:MAG: hypothetical protein JWO68_704 [Actinomycetia bacterium]|nr:hypothetical protein [Actinomycetes bacterium]
MTTMNPAARLSIALLLGLVLWLPTFQATMRGDVDLPESTVRYLVAFLLARIVVAGLARLIHGYAATEDEDGPPMAEPSHDHHEDETPRRRSDDNFSTASGLA